MRNGKDGRETCTAGLIGQEVKAVLELEWEERGKSGNPRRPHITNKAALTVTGDRAAQHDVT